MSITIITSRHFLICESINSITLTATPEYISSDRRRDTFVPFYDININFNPIPNTNNSNQSNSPYPSTKSDSSSYATVRVVGEAPALRFFKEITRQLREQCPDQAYLDKMVENILSGVTEDIHDDFGEGKVDKPRQKKRRNKKVLRGPAKRPKRAKK